ncbi:hypothetical protein D3C73_1643150 [compost metagenome]
MDGIPFTYWIEEALIFSSASKYSFNPFFAFSPAIMEYWAAKPMTIGIVQASANHTFRENIMMTIATIITAVLIRSGS